MKQRTLGSQGLSVSEIGYGAMGTAFAYGPTDDDRIDRGHPARPRARRHTFRHGRTLRLGCGRASPRRSPRSDPRSGDDRDQVRLHPDRGLLAELAARTHP